MNKYGKKCYYNVGLTEIVFINDKADWITINQLSNSAFDKSSLSMLGLPVESPAFSNDWTIRWENISGLREVSFFASGSKIEYVYIKANTK